MRSLVTPLIYVHAELPGHRSFQLITGYDFDIGIFRITGLSGYHLLRVMMLLAPNGVAYGRAGRNGKNSLCQDSRIISKS